CRPLVRLRLSSLSLSYGDGLADRHGNPVPTEHMEAPRPSEPRFVDLEAWPAFPDRLHGQLALEPGQVDPDAEVGTATEGHRGGLEDAVDVVGVGIGVDALVPVRRTHDEQHVGLGRDRHPMERDLPGALAPDELDRRLEAAL